MNFTGERYVPSVEGQIKYEHLHRYALSLQFVSGKSVLDIASGEGYGSSLLATSAGFVAAVDIDPEAVLHAQQNYAHSKLCFAVGSCDAIPLSDASVDAITSFETIEHHDKHQEMFREFKRVLKPGGTLIISSPNKLTYSDEPGYANPFHVKELYYDELDELLRAHFKFVRIYGQRLAAGSFVFPLSPSNENLKPLTGDAKQVADHVCSLPSPIYFVAICSDDPSLEKREISSVYLDGADDLLKALEIESAARIKQMQDQVHRTEDETARKLKQMHADLARQTAAYLKGQAEFEQQIARQSDELKKARTLWLERLSRLTEVRSQLAQAESLIAKREELIHWIYGSRSWQLTRKLYRFEELLEKWRRLWRSKAVFQGKLDSPKSESALTDVIEISGWVYSAAGSVIAVDAFLDGFYLGSVRYGTDRSDVVEASSGKAPLKCGFHEALSTKGVLNLAGAKVLKVRVCDSAGNKQFYTRDIRLSPATADVFQNVLGFLDPESSSDLGSLTINGWAYSIVAPITKIECFIDDFYLGDLQYGVPREDVVAAVPSAPLECGFARSFSFACLKIEGKRQLKVLVRDAKGNTATYTRDVLLKPQAFEGALELPEEGSVCSGSVDLLGWVYSRVAPLATVEAFIDDVWVQTISYGLNRYDVISAFPADAPLACGFKDRISLTALRLEGQRQLTIRVCDEKGNENFIRRTITIKPLTLAPYFAGPPSQRFDAGRGRDDLPKRLENLIAEFQERTDCEPSILDWDSGLNFSDHFPHLSICSPISIQGIDNRLPYLDASIDIVAVSLSALGRIEEARRIASGAVIRSGAGPNGRFEIEWKAAPNKAAALPDTSIVIPVYNNVQFTQNCLEQLTRTLPHNFRGEIIVVDDASSDDTPAVLKQWTEKDDRIKVLRNSENSGFVRACNRGAEAASGEILIFLNNDTLPLAGWLPPLLRILRDKADAGAVGGKLVYPGGELQEAGGIIFSDGSGLNFGTHEDADDPLYNFVREVDYCSGALLATRRALFLELGGFDRRFEPAYYEDTDYCFSLRRKGYRVYYQPESVIVHFEGATSGTDIQSGVKRYQAVNRSKFVDKWRDVLEDQPDPLTRYDFATRCALSMRVPMKSGHED